METTRSALQPAFDHLLAEVNHLEAQARGKKMALNEMAKSMGVDIPFPRVEEESGAQSGRQSIRIDQFLGKPLSTAVAEYLNISGKDRGAKHWREIVQVLRDGGFELGKSKAAEEAARTTILKNTTLFKLVGEDAFGLLKWYPKIKREKEKEGESKPKMRGRPRKAEVKTNEKDEAKKLVKPKKESAPEPTQGSAGDVK